MSGKFAIIDELRARRRALGLDLYEVGRRCGLDETELRDWEHGVGLPSPDALERWAGALGLRLALQPIEAGARRGISVDWKQRHIAVDGTPVRLTPMEWKVLERLAWSPGRLVTHRQLPTGIQTREPSGCARRQARSWYAAAKRAPQSRWQ